MLYTQKNTAADIVNKFLIGIFFIGIVILFLFFNL